MRSVQFTPTVQHCSLATLIGLSLRVKLMQTLPSRFKVNFKPGTWPHLPSTAIGSSGEAVSWRTV